MSNVIDFQEERAKRLAASSHEYVYDINDIVLTVGDLEYDVEVTDDSIIIQTFSPQDDKKEED